MELRTIRANRWCDQCSATQGFAEKLRTAGFILNDISNMESQVQHPVGIVDIIVGNG
jgi:hypothetical protein